MRSWHKPRKFLKIFVDEAYRRETWMQRGSASTLRGGYNKMGLAEGGKICKATTYNGRGTTQSTWRSKVDRLLPKMPVRLGPMANQSPKAQISGGKSRN
jgi:hypothetical protein